MICRRPLDLASPSTCRNMRHGNNRCVQARCCLTASGLAQSRADSPASRYVPPAAPLPQTRISICASSAGNADAGNRANDFLLAVVVVWHQDLKV